MPPTDDVFHFNGINGATGEYLTAPSTAADLLRAALGETVAPAHKRELRAKRDANDPTNPTFAPLPWYDANNLAEVGWAAIFAHDADPAIQKALRPLLDHRRAQATASKERFHVYDGPHGYRPCESKDAFLAREPRRMGPGPADPDAVPYYLLIVGSPEQIPYSFQYQLDVQYAVGRIWFENPDGAPDLSAYANYARSVVAAETGRVKLPRRAAFFGPENADDRATELSSKDLLKPLIDEIPGLLAADTPAWQMESVRGTGADKARLRKLLGGDQTPALLFTASHGMGFPKGDPLQLRHQGALLCQDWPGPSKWRKPIPPEHYFSADDIPADANLLGTVAFHFACYGAGTPKLDDYPTNALRPANQVAERPFVARLPQRLLGHPAGGALAVIGHVERAWGYSIAWADAGRQIQMFKGALKLLMEGSRVGWATEIINQRYADIGTALNATLDETRQAGLEPDVFELARQWTANNDARGYGLIGDPAVKIPLVSANEIPVRSFEAPVREPAFSPPPPTRSPASEVAMKAPAAPTVAAGSTVTFDVPLRITIQLGAAGAVPTTVAVGGSAESFGTGSGIDIDPDYGNREGYDPAFLGAVVPLPKLSAAQRKLAARVDDADESTEGIELKYHHYSAVLNAVRRLAFFVAVNIDGKTHRRYEDELSREKDQWFYDPRVPRAAQFGDELYKSNPFDRGHLVRRLDPAWGRTIRIAKRANDDTFHWTNCSPQHEDFNQGKNVWAGLEDYLLNKATDERKRLVVFTGPVLTDDDPDYRGGKIPKAFWKVAVVGRPNGKIAALGFVVSQEKLLKKVPGVSFGPKEVAETFQTSVANVQALSGLDFGRLKDVDAGAVASFAPGQPPLQLLSDFGDIQLGG